MATDYQTLCANCQKPPNSACANCRLVTYCGKECQTGHWTHHKKDCKSPLRLKNWLPKWNAEKRLPSWIGSDDSPSTRLKYITPNPGEGVKWLWGNAPALDVLQLESNEALDFDGDLNLLFAASGDPRNTIKTIAALPHTYSKKSTIVANDIEFAIVARNTILLLLALTVEDHQLAFESIIHVWYSALIRQSDFNLLQTYAKPLTEDVARKSRLTFTNAPDHQDERDQRSIRHQPEHRLCVQKFNQDGILAPFGYCRDDFTIPNPTLFQFGTWPLRHIDNPLFGWSFPDVLKENCGSATHDMYGKLYCHIRTQLLSFLRRLGETGISFELYHQNAADLPDVLSKSTFARIETANVCEGAYLGLEATLSRLGPLLQSPETNPHATLLTLTIGVTDLIHRFRAYDGKYGKPEQQKDLATMKNYKQMRDLIPNPWVFLPTACDGIPFLFNVEEHFEEYTRKNRYAEIAVKTGMTMRTKHSVIAPSPLRLELKIGEAGFNEEFSMMLAGGNKGGDRYVEWVRAET